MIDFSKELDKVGDIGVKMYRKSLLDARRVATGKTNNSIRFESKPNKLTFYALDHIRNIETGQTADEVKQDASKGDFYQQISDWVQARNIARSPVSVISGLLAKGWEGTDGVITNVDDKVIELATTAITKGVKKEVLNTLKVTK
tara:strand:+ start:454 stop:885 length:432 start_codon:yes stop_codon:yes gene_type:complete